MIKNVNNIIKINISTPIVVEGKYDKIKLKTFINGNIITTDGFRLFNDEKKKNLIKKLCQINKKIIIITDSDNAGRLIRNYLKSFLNSFNMECNIINIYTPQLYGKEKRKSIPSKENILGVEGINIDILIKLLIENKIIDEQHNEIFLSHKENNNKENTIKISKLNFYEDGLTGKTNSAYLRKKFLDILNLPTHLSANAILDIVNNILTYNEYKEIIKKINE